VKRRVDELFDITTRSLLLIHLLYYDEKMINRLDSLTV